MSHVHQYLLATYNNSVEIGTLIPEQPERYDGWG